MADAQGGGDGDGGIDWTAAFDACPAATRPAAAAAAPAVPGPPAKRQQRKKFQSDVYAALKKAPAEPAVVPPAFYDGVWDEFGAAETEQQLPDVLSSSSSASAAGARRA